MTDKVQKIRKEVERIHNLLPIMDGDNISINYADRICTTLEMYIDSLQEEPVSEDLDSFAIKYAQDKPYPVAACQAVKAGAKWQAEQFEKNRLKHCNNITNEQAELEQGFIDQHLDKHQRMPTFLDAIEYGMKLKEQQVMAKAVNIEVKEDAGGYPYIDGTIELYDYSEDKPLAKAGDKVKIIIVKED